jgi:predicted RND superfamily exporter protein
LTDKVRQAVENVSLKSPALQITPSRIATSTVGVPDNSHPALAVSTQKAPFRAEYTGLSPIMHDTQLALLDDLGSSFTTAFFLITPVMMLIARGVRAGLLIMIPNVLPETIVFGSMAWLGYSIDIAGILTASVAMGIAVNDTLHFVNWYSRRLTHGDTREQAIADTFSNCAKAMVHTMLISCCSMVPFLFADFNPTRQFAILMISMMSTSILGDLILLPALLLSPWGKPRRVAPAA